MAIYITEGYVYYNKDFTSKSAARRRIDDDESRRHESMQRQSTYATAVENVQERAPMQATEPAELLFGCLPIPSPGGHCTQLRTWVHNLLMPRPASRPGLGTTIRLWYYHAYLRSQNGHRSSTDTHNWCLSIDRSKIVVTSCFSCKTCFCCNEVVRSFGSWSVMLLNWRTFMKRENSIGTFFFDSLALLCW